jgi:hypothetical protein
MNICAGFCGKFKYLGIYFLIKFTKCRFFVSLTYDSRPKSLYLCLKDKTAIFDINTQSRVKC